MPRASLYSRLGVPPVFDEAHKFVTTPFVRSPFFLAVIRSTIALYILVTILVTLIWKATKLDSGSSYFSFFTYLAYIGLSSYYIAAAVQSLSYAFAWRKKGAGAGYALQRWPKVLQALHVLLQATIVSFPILVTIVFWALLSGPTTFADPFSSYSNISVHALNSVFALIEILFTNSPPPPWLALPFCILCLAGYLGVAYITHATQGFYTYSFLDPTRQHAKLAGWIIGIGVAEAIIFSIVKLIMRLRERWAEAHLRVLIIDRGIEAVSDDDDWEEVARPSAGQVNTGAREPREDLESQRVHKAHS